MSCGLGDLPVMQRYVAASASEVIWLISSYVVSKCLDFNRAINEPITSLGVGAKILKFRVPRKSCS